MIIPLVIVSMGLCIEVSCGQLCVGHIQRFGVGDILDTTEGQFVFEIILTDVEYLLRSIYIVGAVENGLFEFLLGERAVNVEIDLSFLNIHTEMGLDCFE